MRGRLTDDRERMSPRAKGRKGRTLALRSCASAALLLRCCCAATALLASAPVRRGRRRGAAALAGWLAAQAGHGKEGRHGQCGAVAC